MTFATPAHDVAQYILAQMPDITSGAVLRVGDLVSPIDENSEAIMIGIENTNGGRNDDPYIDGGTRDRQNWPRVTVRIRYRNETRFIGEALARRIYDLLNFATLPGYIDCKGIGGGSLDIGQDDDGFPEFAVNLELYRCVEMLPLFYSVQAPPFVVDAAFVQAMAFDIQTIRQTTKSFTIASGQDVWFAIDQSLGAPDFFDSGNQQLLFSSVATVTVTANGLQRTVIVYRLTAPPTGALSVTTI